MRSQQKLKAEGVVIGKSPAKLTIRVNEPEICSGCDSCSFNRSKEIDIENTKGLDIVDSVVLEMDCSTLSGLAFFIYYVPAAAVLTGFLAGYFISGNIGGIIGGSLSMMISFFILHGYTRRRFVRPLNILKKEHNGS